MDNAGDRTVIAVHFLPLNSRTLNSGIQSCVYGMYVWHGLWDLQICVAAVVFSGMGYVCKCYFTSPPGYFLSDGLCLHTHTAMTFSVTQSFPLEWRKQGPGDG